MEALWRESGPVGRGGPTGGEVAGVGGEVLGVGGPGGSGGVVRGG